MSGSILLDFITFRARSWSLGAASLTEGNRLAAAMAPTPIKNIRLTPPICGPLDELRMNGAFRSVSGGIQRRHLMNSETDYSIYLMTTIDFAGRQPPKREKYCGLLDGGRVCRQGVPIPPITSSSMITPSSAGASNGTYLLSLRSTVSTFDRIFETAHLRARSPFCAEQTASSRTVWPFVAPRTWPSFGTVFFLGAYIPRQTVYFRYLQTIRYPGRQQHDRQCGSDTGPNRVAGISAR